MKDEKNSSGKRVDAPVEEFSLIANDTLLALYRDLLKCRMNGAKGKRAARGWAFDGAAVAVASKLAAEDTVIAEVRNPALELLRAKPRRGRSRVNSAPEPGFHLQLQSAVGIALTHKTKRTGKVSVVFGSQRDGAAWLDALEVAQAHRLPIVFVCDADEEKSGARSTRARDAAKLVPGRELAHITADGNDVVAMYRVAHEAIERARRDRGPTLIECIPFRFGGRRNQDAVANMENYLRGKDLLRRGLKKEILEALALQPGTAQARGGARAS
jgi:pyruvate dehydrogenase E1 component alpha subunit